MVIRRLSSSVVNLAEEDRREENIDLKHFQDCVGHYRAANLRSIRVCSGCATTVVPDLAETSLRIANSRRKISPDSVDVQ